MEFFREFVSSLRDTKGRLSRSLYCWYTSLLALLVLTAAAPIALLVRYVSGTGLLFAYLSVLSLLFLLVTPWAIILTVKRFHDFDWSGWLFLAIVLADFVLGLLTLNLRRNRYEVDILLWLIDLAIPTAICTWPGTPGTNRFGSPVSRKSRVQEATH